MNFKQEEISILGFAPSSSVPNFTANIHQLRYFHAKENLVNVLHQSFIMAKSPLGSYRLLTYRNRTEEFPAEARRLAREMALSPRSLQSMEF